MKKKFISTITSLALIFTTVCSGITVPVSAANSDMPDELIDNLEFVRDPETGHISLIEPTAFSSRSGSSESSNGVSPNGLESYYPPNGISEVYSRYPATRNQNPYGTCWAHAATACAEFDMIKQHGHSKSINYSELQLAYFNYNTGSTLPGLEGDKTWIPTDSNAKHYLDVGGNMVYSMHTLSQWKCYTGENILPYSKVATNNNKYFNVEGYFKNTYANSHTASQLRNVRYLDIKNDRSSVKQAIKDHGAVYISYYADSKYYNASTNTYKNTYNTTTNHDIVIVGWNDSKGAWLARNSWQESSSGNGSQYTYFWLSYYDTSLAATAYSLDFEPYSSSDNLYQHDGVAMDTGIYSNSAANVFHANSYMKKGYEKLDSVMVAFTSAANLNYKVDIYTGVSSSSNPTSGKLQSASTTTGWTSSKGIYTIDLKRPVYLSPGEKFSVVVTILNGSTYFRVERDWEVTYTQGETTYSWFNTDAHADAGESFYYYNGTWRDTTKYHDSTYGNFRIKAITSDTSAKPYYITYNLNGGVNSSYNPTSYLSTQTGYFTLNDPSRAGYHFLGWYDSYGAKVTQINYNKQDITLTARWCADNGPERAVVSQPATKSSDGYYTSYCKGCGRLNGSYPIYAISSVKLAADKVTYTGKTISPVPVITNSHGGTLVNGVDFACTYSKSSSKRVNTGRYYLTVKFKDKYSADPVKLYYTVVPKAPSTMSAVLYGYDDIKVSWSKCTGASGYAVYYKKSTTSKYTLLKRTTARSIKKANLSDNVKYDFKIVPYYKYKSGSKYKYDGVNYKTASATTLKKLAQPKMKKDGSRVALTWQSISGASGYQVYWSAKKKGTYKKLCDYSSKYIGMSFSVGKGKTYYYKTRAYKKVGKTKIYGPWSTPKAFKR